VPYSPDNKVSIRLAERHGYLKSTTVRFAGEDTLLYERSRSFFGSKGDSSMTVACNADENRHLSSVPGSPDSAGPSQCKGFAETPAIAAGSRAADELSLVMNRLRAPRIGVGTPCTQELRIDFGIRPLPGNEAIAPRKLPLSRRAKRSRPDSRIEYSTDISRGIRHRILQAQRIHGLDAEGLQIERSTRRKQQVEQRVLHLDG